LKILIFACLLTTMAFATEGTDWPGFRGSANDGKQAHGGLFAQGFGMEIAWKKALGSAYSSVSVAGGTAVTGFSDGTTDFTVGMDANSGAELWRYRIGPTYKGHLGSHDGTIATPLINDGMVYGLNAHGDLFCLDVKNGKQVWRSHLVKDLGAVAAVYGFGTSPLVVGNVLVVHSGGKEAPAAVTGLNKKTGKKLWALGEAESSYQSPIHAELLGKQQVICAMNKKLMGIDPLAGKLLWEYETGGVSDSYIPIMAGKDRVFIRHKDSESTMLQFAKSDSGYAVTPLWTSRELANTSDMGVYHDGYLYGFSGRFLTCVDAETGKRKWKSRPPGSGFVMMADNHLVVITKKGSLHLIEASPKAYRENGSIQVFDSLTWSPPAFANGRAYVRNLKSIASVSLGRVGTTALAAEEKKGVLPKTRFAAWIRELEKATDKKAAIDGFLAEQKSFPIIEDERYVHVVYRGDVPDAAISGQGPSLGPQRPLNHVAGTDFHYYSFEMASDAHITYQLALNFENPGPDPLNPHKAGDLWGLSYKSLLAMPRWSDSNHLAEPEHMGKMVEVSLKSKLTDMERKLRVYLPVGYEKGESRYPVLYVSFGPGAVKKGLLTHTLDNLAGKKMNPVITVFVDRKSYRESQGEMAVAFSAMLVQELVPFIDERFRTLTNQRAILAHSGLAFASLHAALANPGTFTAVATQSGEFHEPSRKILTNLVTSSTKQRILMEWGTYDRVYDSRLNVPAWNKAMVADFAEKGLKVESKVLPMGDEWGNWRTRHDDLLQLLFPLGDM